MTEQQGSETALGPYRVLDLCQGGCLVCGKIMADLGADVIKIEPPGGDPSRSIGPFYKDIPHPEKSLFWFAYNTNKRGITLNLESRDGQEIFRRLVQTADFVLESFPPGYLESLGLGYSQLSQINPGVILTSITPFGQTGPKAHYKGGELTGWASGGALYTMGNPDCPPNWVSFPQAYLHAGVEAAVGSLTAHWHREQTGEGQHVDVSVQDTVIWVLQALPEMWDTIRYDYKRAGGQWVIGSGVGRRQLFRCKDGYVAFVIVGGGLAGATGSTRAMVQWMDEEGMAPDWLKSFDWVNDFDTSRLTQELVDKVEEPFARFLLTKTKAELWEATQQRRLFLAPANNMKELWEDAQLQDRGFWTWLEHPELGETLPYCGAIHKLSETPYQVRRRAPLIGEHNEEVYQKDLGLSREQVILLKQAGVI